MIINADIKFVSYNTNIIQNYNDTIPSNSI